MWFAIEISSIRHTQHSYYSALLLSLTSNSNLSSMYVWQSRAPAASTGGTSGAGGSGEPSAGPASAPAAATTHIQLQLQPEPAAPSAWLSEVLPRKTPYFPQMGDEVRL